MEKAVLILLVEDEAMIALEVQDALNEGGYAVSILTNGTDAIAALDDAEHHFAGLVTDIQLGNGPEGWDVAQRARELYPDIPVVYMSGNRAGDHNSRGVPNSVMVRKPFASAQIVTAISTLINNVSSPPTT